MLPNPRNAFEQLPISGYHVSPFTYTETRVAPQSSQYNSGGQQVVRRKRKEPYPVIKPFKYPRLVGDVHAGLILSQNQPRWIQAAKCPLKPGQGIEDIRHCTLEQLERKYFEWTRRTTLSLEEEAELIALGASTLPLVSPPRNLMEALTRVATHNVVPQSAAILGLGALPGTSWRLPPQGTASAKTRQAVPGTRSPGSRENGGQAA